MKIFETAQIRRWDLKTMEKQAISATELMLRAGTASTAWIKKYFNKQTLCFIVLGSGGNAGDGLVIARGLVSAGYQVHILFSSNPASFKGATADHYRLLQEVPTATAPTLATSTEGGSGSGSNTGRLAIYHMAQLPDFLAALSNKKKRSIIIDTLLGTGFLANRKNSPLDELIHQLNASGLPIIAIDIPSGLIADQLPASASQQAPAIIKAQHTLSFQSYKRSFLHPEAAAYTGKVHILDIGLSKGFRKKEPTNNFVTGLRDVARIYQSRASQPFGHKGSFGTVAIVGGSYGKIGAVALSAKAALRAGAGKVFIQAPSCANEILQTAVPEAMFEEVGERYITSIQQAEKTTYGIGPGMDTKPASIQALHHYLKHSSVPAVLDADALNIVATDIDLFLPLIAKSSILTPHPGEFKRLFGQQASSLAEVELARQMAIQHQIIIVLKGHHTAVCSTKGAVYYNLSGNAGMATAGSGDVLTGIITALLAQGYNALHAARLGVYLHGLAGDYYVKHLGAEESLMAGDLISCLPKAFKRLQKAALAH